jgi:predicted transcriptional regulator
MPSKKRSQKTVQLQLLMGPLEAEVMQIFWKQGPSLVSEIETILNQGRSAPLAYKTVLTICTRLGEKSLLSYDKEGRAFRYRPVKSRQEYLQDQAARATNEVLETFGDLAVAGFVDRVAADPDQLAALRELIDRKERGFD